MNRARKFLELSGRERRLFLEAVVMHLWVGLLLKMIPFRWIIRHFSNQQPAAHTTSCAKLRMSKKASVAGHSLQPDDISLIKIAVGRANVVSPWKNRCLVSSLAGRGMLRRRKIASHLSLGVAKNIDGRTIAHAWLRTGDVEIVSAGEGFQELYHF